MAIRSMASHAFSRSLSVLASLEGERGGDKEEGRGEGRYRCNHLCIISHFSTSSLYLVLHSSNSFWFISANIFKALYISPRIVLQEGVIGGVSQGCGLYKEHVLVPVLLGVLEERGEDNGEQGLGIVPHQTHDVIVAPIVQSSLCYLCGREGCGQTPPTRPVKPVISPGSGEMRCSVLSCGTLPASL